LEAEKEELKKNLNLAESKTNNIKDEHKTETLESLLEAKGKFSSLKNQNLLSAIFTEKKCLFLSKIIKINEKLKLKRRKKKAKSLI